MNSPNEFVLSHRSRLGTALDENSPLLGISRFSYFSYLTSHFDEMDIHHSHSLFFLSVLPGSSWFGGVAKMRSHRIDTSMPRSSSPRVGVRWHWMEGRAKGPAWKEHVTRRLDEDPCLREALARVVATALMYQRNMLFLSRAALCVCGGRPSRRTHPWLCARSQHLVEAQHPFFELSRTN